MKNSKKFSGLIPFVLLIFVILGCNMSTANLSELKVSKDKEGKQTSSTFKGGDTIYAKATVANNPGKVTVKTYLVAEDVKGIDKGETIKGSEVPVELNGDGRSEYELPIPPGAAPGKYKLIADMINEAGEKKDSKSAEITIEKSSGEQKTEPQDSEDAPDDEGDSES